VAGDCRVDVEEGAVSVENDGAGHGEMMGIEQQ
jgi:hypothetical protein